MWVIMVMQLLGVSCQAQGIYLQSTSVVSNRSAILEDDGCVAYLYLCKPGTFIPEREAVVYSRRPPVPKVDWWELSKTGETAPISQDIASPTAMVARPSAAEFTFKWSRDGESVAILRHGQALAFAIPSHLRGYSKAVTRPSTLAMPWDQQAYESTFGK